MVIAAGSAAGGVLRHVTTEAVIRLAGDGFPWGTLTVNVAGSLAIGACVAVSATAGPGMWSPIARHATMTGPLGGFTTFSTFSAQTMALLQQGQWPRRRQNALASVGLSVLACALGYAVVAAGLR